MAYTKITDINNGDTGASIRPKLNQSFQDIYNAFEQMLPKAGGVMQGLLRFNSSSMVGQASPSYFVSLVPYGNNADSGSLTYTSTAQVKTVLGLPANFNFLPLAGGTVNGDVTANKFVKSDGTSSQFLKADGSVDSNTYATQTWVEGKGYTSNAGTVTSVRVQATSPVVSSVNTAQTGSLNTTISLANNYGDTKNPYAAKTKNTVLAGPSSGNNAVPTFRALVADDLPTIPYSKLSGTPTVVSNIGYSNFNLTKTVGGSTTVVVNGVTIVEDGYNNSKAIQYAVKEHKEVEVQLGTTYATNVIENLFSQYAVLFSDDTSEMTDTIIVKPFAASGVMDFSILSYTILNKLNKDIAKRRFHIYLRYVQQHVTVRGCLVNYANGPSGAVYAQNGIPGYCSSKLECYYDAMAKVWFVEITNYKFQEGDYLPREEFGLRMGLNEMPTKK